MTLIVGDGDCKDSDDGRMAIVRIVINFGCR